MTSSNYEFSSADSKSFVLSTRVTLTVSLLLLSLALVRFYHLQVNSALVRSGFSAFNYSDNFIELLSVFLPIVCLLFASFQFFQSSRFYRLIVLSSGRDIVLLQMATNSLANALLFFVLFMLTNTLRWAVWVDEVQRCISSLR